MAEETRRIPVQPISISRSEGMRLSFITDSHLGNGGVDEAVLKADIARVREEDNHYAIIGGDMIEAINIGDRRRWNSSTIAPWVDFKQLENIIAQEVEYFLDLFRPIAHKIIGMIRGNHEDASRKYSGFDPYPMMVKGLLADQAGLSWKEAAARDLGWGDYIVLDLQRTKTSRRRFTIWAHHGFGSGTLAGAHALNLQRAVLFRPSADLILMGHRHILAYQEEYYERLNSAARHKDGVLVVEAVRKGMQIPGYMRGYITDSNKFVTAQNYTEVKGMKPARLGTIPWTIYPDGTSEVTI